MTAPHVLKHHRWTIIAALLLVWGIASAASTAPQAAVPQASDSGVGTTLGLTSASDAVSHASIEKGVRDAAAQGSEALRRYVHRTRMIYNYYFWDFVQKE